MLRCEGMEDRLSTVGPAPDHSARVQFDPHDGTVLLRRDPVWIGVVQLLEDVSRAVVVQDTDTPTMGADLGRPITGIGEIEAAIRAKAEVVWPIERHPVGMRRENFDLAARPDALNAGRSLVRRNPAPGGWTIGDVDVAVAAKSASVRRPTSVGVAAQSVVRTPGHERASIRIGEDDAAVRKSARTFGLTNAFGENTGGPFHRRNWEGLFSASTAMIRTPVITLRRPGPT